MAFTDVDFGIVIDQSTITVYASTLIQIYFFSADNDLSFHFGNSGGGNSAYKSALYQMPGLGLHGLAVDSLHAPMAGYPGGMYGYPCTYIFFL